MLPFNISRCPYLLGKPLTSHKNSWYQSMACGLACTLNWVNWGVNVVSFQPLRASVFTAHSCHVGNLSERPGDLQMGTLGSGEPKERGLAHWRTPWGGVRFHLRSFGSSSIHGLLFLCLAFDGALTSLVLTSSKRRGLLHRLLPLFRTLLEGEWGAAKFVTRSSIRYGIS